MEPAKHEMEYQSKLHEKEAENGTKRSEREIEEKRVSYAEWMLSLIHIYRYIQGNS